MFRLLATLALLAGACAAPAPPPAPRPGYAPLVYPHSVLPAPLYHHPVYRAPLLAHPPVALSHVSTVYNPAPVLPAAPLLPYY